MPNRAELDLLRSALHDRPITPAAAGILRLALERRAQNLGLLRLLPLLSQRAAALAEYPEILAAALAERRRSAMRWVGLTAFAERIAAGLNAEGITPLVLKGYALAGTNYPSIDLRPMEDIDLAVRPEEFDRAAGIVAGMGFTLVDAVSTSPMRRHGVEFQRPGEKFQLDLHQHVLFCSRWPSASDGFWHRAAPFAIGNQPALTLCAEDHLLHACIHGYRHNPVSPIRWMVDAALIVARPGIDWQVLIDEAERHRCGPLLAAALHFLVLEVEAEIPQTVLEALSDLPWTRNDRRYFRAQGHRLFQMSLAAAGSRLIRDYARQTQVVDGREAAMKMSFAGWLRDYRNVRSNAALMREIAAFLRKKFVKPV